MAEKRPADAAPDAHVGSTKKATTNAIGSRDWFLEVYDELVHFLITEILPTYDLPAEVIEWNRKMIEYNVPGGKLNRGISVVHTLQILRGGELTHEEARRAAVLGWCLEWLQAFFLVADDVMDGSITRRGQPCWYKHKHVGLIAINDGCLLVSHLYKILAKYFRPEPYYVQLLELFLETTFQTELGQLVDLTTQPLPESGEPINLERFTLERYRAIVKYKTAYYSFYLPVACGLILAGLASDAILATAHDILLPMGEYFQIQDDYLDCYADPSVLGKIGTDIQDNKCSWLVVQAMLRATPAQKERLIHNYGQHDDAKIAAVKELYRELDIENVYKAYEAEVYGSLCAKIDAACGAGSPVPKEVYLSFLHKIYKRKH